ncbi:tetratricopeptide repeat protein [Salinivibrio sp. IB282]|uniref:tetratricopeptide repeat protein n=1 Tax=Salinivibrio sp. IB282 TaxID=1766122 RepID=UPI0009887A43|nr:tetratricopeptide repeat protein [Salinivibrio sp. IB282]OOE57615.1 hypothetical protein BZG14_14905 [Salinivibrio sp. IB282]
MVKNTPINVDDTLHSQTNEFIDDLILKYGENEKLLSLMALEATALATSVSARGQEIEEQSHISRLWRSFTGKNQKIFARNDQDLAKSQYIGQQILNKLSENNLLTYEIVVLLGNKVNRIAEQVNETQNALITLNQDLTVFFSSVRKKIEENISNLERNDNLLFWKETILFHPALQGRGYSDLTRLEKIICLANDFYQNTQKKWSFQDLSFLKSVIEAVNEDPNESVVLRDICQICKEKPLLLNRLFQGVDENPKLEEIRLLMPVFMSVGQLKRLNDSDEYIFNALLECSPNISEEDAYWALSAKYVQQVTGIDLNKEVSFFDAIMILVEDLVCYSKFHGFPDSIESEGEIYESIVIETSEPEKLIPDIDTIKLLAEKGDVSAEYALGRAYYLGEDVPENKHVARRWLRKSAEKGNVNAQVLLGRDDLREHRLTGKVAYCRESKINPWLEKAMQQSHPSAFYYTVENWEPPFDPNPRWWIEKAAELGHVEAQYEMYEYNTPLGNAHGTDNEKLKINADFWLSKAAQQGSVNALCELIRRSNNVKNKDFSGNEKEKYWFSLILDAAEYGEHQALCFLGDCYSKGIYVERDFEKAILYYTKADEEGNIGAASRKKGLLRKMSR